jgi:hypothetical protein
MIEMAEMVFEGFGGMLVFCAGWESCAAKTSRSTPRRWRAKLCLAGANWELSHSLVINA